MPVYKMNQFATAMPVIIFIFSFSSSYALNQGVLIADSSSTANNQPTLEQTTQIYTHCHCDHPIGSTLLKTAFGAGLGILGIFIGGAVGQGIEAGMTKCNGLLCGLNGFLIGGSIGFLFMEPLGVYIGGHTMEEGGSYIGTFFGHTAGWAVGIGILALTKPKNDYVGIGIYFSFPIAGSIFGYNHLMRRCR